MEFQNFPQPTRPLSFSKLTSFKYSAASLLPLELVIIQDSESLTSSSKGQKEEGEEDEVFDELTEILFECLEQVDTEHRGLLLLKIFSELEKDSQLESFIVDKLKHARANQISAFLETYTESLQGKVCENEINYDQEETISRGFNGDLMEIHGTGLSIEQFSYKLERFKVKTVNVGGVVTKK